ncbi:MAG: PspC domain-containing protein [Acidobacteriales bacterium]|nr:PspC domain-containing protein [Terriglobales bacterium]
MQYCNHCGRTIQYDANFCAYCGVRITGFVGRRRLVRPRAGRGIGGVCAGLANFFDLDVALMRIVWVIMAIFTGVGFIAYLVAWLVIPNEPDVIVVPPPVPNQQTVSS